MAVELTFEFHSHIHYLHNKNLFPCTNTWHTGDCTMFYFSNTYNQTFTRPWADVFVNSYLLLQVNLCQKLLFLHQLNHNLTTDCWWNYNENYKRRTCNSMNNLLSYCGLVDATISASEEDLPVWPAFIWQIFWRKKISLLSL